MYANGFPLFRRYGKNLPSSFNVVSSTPKSSRLVHLCRFRVRSSRPCEPPVRLFLHTCARHSYPKCRGSYTRCGTTYRSPSGKAVAFALRGRITLRWLPERKKTLNVRRSCLIYMIFRYSCQHSHFWTLHESFRPHFSSTQNASLP